MIHIDECLIEGEQMFWYYYFLMKKLKSTQYKNISISFWAHNSHIKIWNIESHMKKQNKKPSIIDEKVKRKSLIVSYFSCDLKDFKF